MHVLRERTSTAVSVLSHSLIQRAQTATGAGTEATGTGFEQHRQTTRQHTHDGP
jgi:hypothetical protein